MTNPLEYWVDLFQSFIDRLNACYEQENLRIGASNLARRIYFEPQSVVEAGVYGGLADRLQSFLTYVKTEKRFIDAMSSDEEAACNAVWNDIVIRIEEQYYRPAMRWILTDNPAQVSPIQAEAKRIEARLLDQLMDLMKGRC